MRRAVFTLLGIAAGTAAVVGAKIHPAVRYALAGGPPAPTRRLAPRPSGPALPAGTYMVTGPVEPTPHGRVQVRVTVAGGRIADVTALQLPTGGRSTEINQAAVPVLRQEALVAQSADIDAVSGATNTSAGYVHSLQAALDAAKRGKRG
jgi:uncharacterized protein with FMN-binding domain